MTQTTTSSGLKLNAKEIVLLTTILHVQVEGKRERIEKELKKSRALLSFHEIAGDSMDGTMLAIDGVSGRLSSGDKVVETLKKHIEEGQKLLQSMDRGEDYTGVIFSTLDKLRPSYELIKSTEYFDEIVKELDLNPDSLL